MAKKPRRTPKGGTNKKADALTKNESAFCKAYAMEQNGAAAYGIGYPASLKHDPQYRAKKAAALLVKGKIRVQIETLRQAVSEVVVGQFKIDAESVLQELAAIAFANSGDYYDWGTRTVTKTRKNGTTYEVQEQYAHVKNSDSLSRVQKAAIVGADMTMSKEGTPLVGVKMADKRAALVDLGKHLGLFKGENGGGGPNLAIQIVLNSVESAL